MIARRIWARTSIELDGMRLSRAGFRMQKDTMGEVWGSNSGYRSLGALDEGAKEAG